MNTIHSLQMKIYFRRKRCFHNLVSFIAICCQVQLFPMNYLKNLRVLQRGGNRLDYPTSTTQTNNSSKKLVRILIIMTE